MRRRVFNGGYIQTDQLGEQFGRMTPQERPRRRSSVRKIHPDYRSQVSNGISVCWNKVPYSAGAWATWSQDARSTRYPTLNLPDGPIHFAGEHMSYLTGWQEGAVLSAHAVVRAIADRVKARKG
jgi:monoamine oxidase